MFGVRGAKFLSGGSEQSLMYALMGVIQSVVAYMARIDGSSIDGRSNTVCIMDERPLASGLEASFTKTSALVF